MTVLIKQVRLIFPGHQLNGEEIDVLKDGKQIIEINPKSVSSGVKIIDAKGMLLFPSLVDTFTTGGEPGLEEREDFESLCQAARNGGFGHLFLLPDLDPVTDSKSEASFIWKNGSCFGVNLYPLGAISRELKGKSLSEMFDMHKTGIPAFSDGFKAIEDVNLMKRALDYSKGFDALIMSYPHDERVAPGGMVNESVHNTALGLKSMPSLAEELMVNRDVYLAEYTQAKLHFACISTMRSVELIKAAKAKKIAISAGVAMHSLLFTENELQNFDTSYKVQPPLRGKDDIKALIKALKSGVIDVIHSAHRPEVIEHKDVEFDQAHYGMTMLETFLSAYQMKLSKELSWDEFINCTSLAPRALMGMSIPDFEEEANWDFVLFDPAAKWTYNQQTKASKGSNSPFLNMELSGKVVEH